MAACFSYKEPSPGQQLNEVPVHSVNVRSMGSHIVYNFSYIMNQYVSLLVDGLKIE